jgi:hypothetical protein
MMYTVDQILQAIDTLERPDRERLMRELGGDDRPHDADISHAGATERSYVLTYQGGDEELAPAYRLSRNRDKPGRVVELGRESSDVRHAGAYDSLIAGLEDLAAESRHQGEDLGQLSVEVRGDSRLVIQQLLGNWRTSDSRLLGRRERALLLLAGFADYRLTEVRTAQIEQTLGR